MRLRVLRALDLRRRLLRGLAGVVLTVAVLSQTAVCVAAQRANSAPRRRGEVVVKAPQAILMDAESGAIMFQRSADELMYPASMSKLMLLAVAFKALKAGEIKLEDQFFMSEYAWRKGGAPSGNVGDVRAGRHQGHGRRAAQGHHRAVGQRRGHLDCREHGR